MKYVPVVPWFRIGNAVNSSWTVLCIMETIDVLGMGFVSYCLALIPNCVLDVLQHFQTFYNLKSVKCLNEFSVLRAR